MKKIISILSAKGGVGKTTITINLGLALHQFNELITVVDGDLKCPTIGLHLGMYDFPITMQNIMKQDTTILEALYVHPSGLRIIPASISMEYLNTGTLKKDMFEGLTGIILMDSPPGLGSDVMSIINISDEILIATNPELPALSSGIKLVEMLENMGKPASGMILNRAEKKKLSIKPDEIASIFNLPMLGVIPEDRLVRESIMAKRPVILYKPYSRASIAIKKLAAKLLGKEYKLPRFLLFRRIFSNR